MRNLIIFLLCSFSVNGFLNHHRPTVKSALKQGMDEYLNFNESGMPIPPQRPPQSGVRIIFKPGEEGVEEFFKRLNSEDNEPRTFGNRGGGGKKKSQNFEVYKYDDLSFEDIGGYENIKSELMPISLLYPEELALLISEHNRDRIENKLGLEYGNLRDILSKKNIDQKRL